MTDPTPNAAATPAKTRNVVTPASIDSSLGSPASVRCDIRTLLNTYSPLPFLSANPPRRNVAPALSPGAGRRAVPDGAFEPPLTLVGTHVALVPLERAHAPDLI